jgi:hypothetical protein
MKTYANAATVYGLYSHDELRYVGATTMSLNQRLRHHWNRSKLKNTPLYTWLKTEKRNDIEIRPLVIVEYSQRYEYERNVISAMFAAGHPLVNIWHTPRDADIRERLGGVMRGKKMPEQTRQAIIKHNRGRQKSPEHAAKISAARRTPKLRALSSSQARRMSHTRYHSDRFVNHACEWCAYERTTLEMSYALWNRVWLDAEKLWKTANRKCK